MIVGVTAVLLPKREAHCLEEQLGFDIPFADDDTEISTEVKAIDHVLHHHATQSAPSPVGDDLEVKDRTGLAGIRHSEVPGQRRIDEGQELAAF